MQTQQQASTRRVRPTTPTDLWRLAEQGQQNGVRILTECVSGERFATSASEPGTVYRLTAHGCTCKGFNYHSLLLAQLVWLPDPEPAPAAAPRCSTIQRFVRDLDGRWVDPETGELLAA